MYRQHIRSHLAVYLVMGLEGAHGRDAIDIARAALQGGVTVFQLREKQAPLSEVLAVGAKLCDLCRSYGVPFIVNDRVDVAMLLDADGVHVGQDDIPAPLARRLLGDHKIVGVSAGTDAEAERAIADGADYLGVGAVYATSTKADAGAAIGTALITRISGISDVPIVGIGGVTSHNAAPVIAAGADGVAVVTAITRQADPRLAADQLKQTIADTLAKRR